jgi:hypothetical protein
MALVHAIILELTPVADGTRDEADMIIYHASITSASVDDEVLPRHLHRMRRLHRGYAVYRLDPMWDPTGLDVADGDATLACEKKLPGQGTSRGLHATGP